VIVAYRKLFQITVKIAVSHCRSIGRMCIAIRISFFWIWNDDNIRTKAKSYQHFRLLSMSAILNIQQTMVSPAVGRGRLHAASFVIPLRLWNDVSIFYNSAVTSISGSAAMLTLTVENMLTIIAVGQLLLSWCRPNFWIWNDIVISETCYVITTSGSCPQSWILDTRWYANMIVLQSTVNKATFEVLYKALIVSKTQLSLHSYSICR